MHVYLHTIFVVTFSISFLQTHSKYAFFHVVNINCWYLRIHTFIHTVDDIFNENMAVSVDEGKIVCYAYACTYTDWHKNSTYMPLYIQILYTHIYSLCVHVLNKRRHTLTHTHTHTLSHTHTRRSALVDSREHNCVSILCTYIYVCTQK